MTNVELNLNSMLQLPPLSKSVKIYECDTRICCCEISASRKSIDAAMINFITIISTKVLQRLPNTIIWVFSRNLYCKAVGDLKPCKQLSLWILTRVKWKVYSVIVYQYHKRRQNLSAVLYKFLFYFVVCGVWGGQRVYWID